MKASIRPLVLTLFALCIGFPLSAADPHNRVVEDRAADVAVAWPVVATNQAAEPRPDLEITTQMRVPADCPVDCGGSCGYEIRYEAVCRTVGDYSQDCQPAAGRYCVRKVYSEDVEDGGTGQPVSTCQTCFYGFGLD